jgi:hypothetical protein
MRQRKTKRVPSTFDRQYYLQDFVIISIFLIFLRHQRVSVVSEFIVVIAGTTSDFV